MRKSVLVMMALLLLLMPGCGIFENEADTPKRQWQPSPIQAPTSEALMIRLVEWLNYLAITPEAKEYVYILTMNLTMHKDSLEGDVYIIGITSGQGAWDAIEDVDWFKIEDQDYFFDNHWGEPKPTWLIYQDGRVVPIGKGIIVESDIQQLNIDRELT